MKKILNGKSVPYDLPYEELVKMLSSDNMTDFCIACEALSEYNTEEACEKMGEYLFCKDKYRRLYILKTIFRNQYAEKYIPEIINSIQSEDILFANIGLELVKELNIKVSEKIIIDAISRHFKNLEDSLYSLYTLSNTENNYEVIKSFFIKADRSLKMERLAEILVNKFIDTHSFELFSLFSNSTNAK